MSSQNQPEIRGPMQPGYETVLTPAALAFVADLTRRFGGRVAELLEARDQLQKRLDDGVLHGRSSLCIARPGELHVLEEASLHEMIARLR